MGAFELTFEGTGLTAASDVAMVVSGSVCDEAAAVAAPVAVTAGTSGKVALATTVAVPGTYRVCYRLGSLSGANDYLLMAEALNVTGPQTYSPLFTAGGSSQFTLTFSGLGLDSTAVGDSVRLVKGTDCVNDPAVAASGGPSFVPSDVSDATQLNLTLSVPEGGRYTVCYKATFAGAYTALSPRFEVSGASVFSPTVVSQGYTGTFALQGALLSSADSVAVVPAGITCGLAGTTALGWTRSTATAGIASVTSAATLASSGTYYLCYTPSNGAQYQIATPLTVTGVTAGGVSPQELVAAVEDVVTVSGTGVSAGDRIKLVDQTTEKCTAAFPGHGTITPLSQVGTYSVVVPYGGVFTLCYSAAGADFAAADTITVRGPRALSPYSPVVAAVGVAVQFEVEGAGLGTFDTLSVVANSSQGCAAAPAVPVPTLTAVSTTLVRAATGTVFNRGGDYLLCYTVSGGSALQLSPSLVVKGPQSFTPTSANFGTTTTLNFTGVALSAQDSLAMTSSAQQNCSDTASTTAITVATAGSAQVTPSIGGTYYICYKPFEGQFVALPTPLTVSGPRTMTPTTWSAGVAQTVTFTGVNLAAGDNAMVVQATAGCNSSAALSVGAVTASLTAALTVAEVGTHIVCYQLSGGSYAYFDTVSVTGVQSYAPTQLTVSETATLTLSGQGLDKVRDRVVVQTGSTCPTAAPNTAVAASGLEGTNDTLKLTTAILTGGTNRAVCHWDGSQWSQVQPGLTVLGPSAREAVNASAPLTAGAPLQYTITGVGLTAGLDRVKWVAVSSAAPGPIANCSGTEAVAAQAALTSSTAGAVLTPSVSLTGGRYALCYALGTSGAFIPIGDPVGGAVGGAVGEVVVAGPSSYWAGAEQTRAGQMATIAFNGDGLQPSAQHWAKLSTVADCSGAAVPIEGTGVDTATYEMKLAGASAQLVAAPLRGGDFYVCFKTDGGGWIALPSWNPSGGVALTSTTPTALSVDGPSSLAVTLPVGTGMDELEAGTVYTLAVSGNRLSTNASAARFVSAATGCVGSTAASASTLVMPDASTPSIVTATFHSAGVFALCYLYTGDVDTVSQFDLTQAKVRGMYSPGSWVLPFGTDAGEITVPYNSTTPSPDVWLWPVAAGAPSDATVVALCGDAAALAAAGAVRGTLSFTATQSLAAYNVTHASPGANRVCIRQGQSSTYVALLGLAEVEGPAGFTPTSVTVPGSYRIVFSGIGLSDTDSARLVPLGDTCSSASPLLDQTLSGLGVRTPSLATPAQYSVCYKMGAPTGRWVKLSHTFFVTGAASALVLEAPLPGSSVAGVAFVIMVRLADAAGSIVPRDGGRMTLSTATGPGVPSPAAGSALTQRVTNGRANFTVSLGTAGVHVLAVQYDDAGCCGNPSVALSLTTAPVSVAAGSVSAVATQFTGGRVASMEAFDVTFQTVDAGFNAVALPFAATQAVLTALDSAAASGQLLGTTTIVASASGSGTFSQLQIDKVGRYSLVITTVADSSLPNATNGSAVVKSAAIEIIVTEGSPTGLVLLQQWAAGTSVVAATQLTLRVSAQDAGGNTLHVADPVPMFLRIATDPVPPSQGRLYAEDPDLCAMVACQTLRDAVLTQSGVATFANFWLNAAGAYKLQVTAPGGLSATTNLLVVTLGTAHHLRIFEGASRVDVFQPFAFSVAVADRGGNVLVSTPAAMVTVEVAPPYTAVQLGGLLTRVLVSGSAVFPSLTLSTKGVYRLRFRHSTLGIVGDTEDIYVEAPVAAPLDLRPYLVVHLNVPIADVNATALRSTASSLAGLTGVDYVQVAELQSVTTGGTRAYLQFTGTQDADSRAQAVIDATTLNSTGQAGSWQGGELLSSPVLVREVPEVPTTSTGDSSGESGLQGWEIGVIVAALVLFLVAVAFVLLWCVRKRRGAELEQDIAESSMPQRTGTSYSEADMDRSRGVDSEAELRSTHPPVSENPLNDEPFGRTPARQTRTPAPPLAADLQPQPPPLLPPLQARPMLTPAVLTPRDPAGDVLPPPSPPPPPMAYHARDHSPAPPPRVTPAADDVAPLTGAEYAARNEGVVAWLRGVAGEAFIPQFAAAGVTSRDLYGFTDADLLRVGVHDPQHRAAMLQSLETYRAGL
eukprot:TRINITY_DN10652_c2_g1_i2.p1 TRINITY_DN10652_c2_g1~~TRINITY_DN10652_c2_g1_i2.p1  ORF type:complete len:2106 (+),score=594.81 TRINITY_DN10652_c2_g1_i2:850-7167(+)